MKIEELFNGDLTEPDRNNADKTSELPAELKERIFSRIQCKMLSQQDDRIYNDSVSGVERYRTSVFRRFLGVSASVAAAAVITISSLYIYGSRREVKNDKKNSVLNSLEYSDHAAIAKLLTEEFISASGYINGDVITADTSRHFYEYSSRNSEWQGEDVDYYMIDDKSFDSCSEIYDTICMTVTDEYFDTLKNSGGSYLSRSIDEAVESSGNTSAPVLVEYNGMLYTTEKNTDASPAPSEPQIQNNEKYGFSACVSTDKEYVFDFVWNGKQWRINDVRMS